MTHSVSLTLILWTVSVDAAAWVKSGSLNTLTIFWDRPPSLPNGPIKHPQSADRDYCLETWSYQHVCAVLEAALT